MRLTGILCVFVLCSVATPQAMAACNVSDAKLEEAVLRKPEFRDPANRQMVRDLRSLRDSALILWSYGRHDDCERLLSTIREFVSSPSMGSLGGNDEDEADQQLAAQEPIIQRSGAIVGRRKDIGARPLIDIDDMEPGLRADEIIGAEVRSSDDKIVGEVRNIIFGTKGRPDYAIVASGGFFIPGKDSIVVPMRSLSVSQERESFYLPISESQAKNIPLMPDQEYQWMLDQGWRARNDALFATP